MRKNGFIVALIDTKRYKYFLGKIFYLAKILLKSSRSDSRVKFISNVLKIITNNSQFNAIHSTGQSGWTHSVSEIQGKVDNKDLDRKPQQPLASESNVGLAAL